MDEKKWVCPLCGGTEIGVRNFYKNQAKGTIGFAVEEYCKGCGVALSSIPHILETRALLKKNLSSKQTKTEK